jgi:hypothetical protein
LHIDRIEIRHASGSVAERVRRWFETTRRVGKLDGSRSVRLPHPDKSGFDIKIKGAGFLGGPIRFGRHLRSGPTAPVFDFDGRMMKDVASGHDNSFLGGASFQQASTEYAITQILAGLGFPVVPCVGYGRLATLVHDSWFSIFEWDRAWCTFRHGSSFGIRRWYNECGVTNARSLIAEHKRRHPGLQC